LAKKKSAKKLLKLKLKKWQKNLLVGIVVVAVVVVVYYLLASEKGLLNEDDGTYLGEEDDTYLQSQQDLIENLPQITGQSYFGYLKEGYVLHVMSKGNDERIEFKTLNEDYTVDIVMNRAYNLEIGETVLADYDYDGAADVSLTLDGIDYYNNRFSATITYFGELPEEIISE
jgi:hypothetical protein